MLDLLHRPAVVALALLWATSALAVDQQPDGTVTSTDNTCDGTPTAHETTDDDVDSPDSVFCDGSSSTADPLWLMNLTTPSALDDGTDQQVMAIAIKRSGGGGNVPTVTMNIFDGTNCADLHESGSSQNVTDTSVIVLTEAWTSSGISGAADVCIQIVCIHAGSGGSARTCDLDAAEWRAAEVGGARRRTSLVE